MSNEWNKPEPPGYYVLKDKMNDRRYWDSSHPEYESYNAEIRKGFEALYGDDNAPNADGRNRSQDACKLPPPERDWVDPDMCGIDVLNERHPSNPKIVIGRGGYGKGCKRLSMREREETGSDIGWKPIPGCTMYRGSGDS